MKQPTLLQNTYWYLPIRKLVGVLERERRELNVYLNKAVSFKLPEILLCLESVH